MRSGRWGGWCFVGCGDEGQNDWDETDVAASTNARFTEGQAPTRAVR